MSNVQNLYKTETLEQMLLRCRSETRPNITGLWEDIFIFEDHPKPEKIIEITGLPNSGKTLTLLEFMARCILPQNSGGKECEVIFFNCDNKFSMQCFMQILEKIVKSIEVADDEKIISIVETSIKRLKIYYCFTSDELELALISSSSYLFKNNDVGLICLDSIGSFYWDACAESYQENRFHFKMETYYNKIFESVKRICEKFKLNAALTIPNYFIGKITLLGDYNFNLTNNDAGKDLIQINIKSEGTHLEKFIAFNSNGIKII